MLFSRFNFYLLAAAFCANLIKFVVFYLGGSQGWNCLFCLMFGCFLQKFVQLIICEATSEICKRKMVKFTLELLVEVLILCKIIYLDANKNNEDQHFSPAEEDLAFVLCRSTSSFIYPIFYFLYWNLLLNSGRACKKWIFTANSKQHIV